MNISQQHTRNMRLNVNGDATATRSSDAQMLSK